MREFWHRFWTNLRWFLGTIIVLAILIALVWRGVDREGFTTTVNGWMHDLWEITKFILGWILAFAIVFAGIRWMFGKKPFHGSKGH